MNATVDHVRMELHVTMMPMDIHVRVLLVILGTSVMKVIFMFYV